MTATVLNSYGYLGNSQSVHTQEYTDFEKLMFGRFGAFTIAFFAIVLISDIINAIANSPSGACTL